MVPFSPNRTIGSRYTIRRVLSDNQQGGMSCVYEATDERLGRRCAVKQLCAEGTPGEVQAAIKGFEYEAKLLASLDRHPGIVYVYDHFAEGSDYFLVAEWVAGETLEAIVERNRSNLQDVYQWGVAVCEILEFLHAQTPPVIHSDVKASNLMLTPSGQIMLLDFGIAKSNRHFSGVTQALTATGGTGTPGYAAPEQYKDDGVIDERTDIYGLGATLYHLLTGVHPKHNQVLFQFQPISQLRKDRVPDGLERIVMQALETKPEARFASVSDMKAVLKRSQAGTKRTTQPSGSQPITASVGSQTTPSVMVPAPQPPISPLRRFGKFLNFVRWRIIGFPADLFLGWFRPCAGWAVLIGWILGMAQTITWRFGTLFIDYDLGKIRQVVENSPSGFYLLLAMLVFWTIANRLMSSGREPTPVSAFVLGVACFCIMGIIGYVEQNKAIETASRASVGWGKLAEIRFDIEQRYDIRWQRIIIQPEVKPRDRSNQSPSPFPTSDITPHTLQKGDSK